MACFSYGGSLRVEAQALLKSLRRCLHTPRSAARAPQVNESKYEMEKLTRELQDVKRKYYEQKRKGTLEKEMRRTMSN